MTDVLLLQPPVSFTNPWANSGRDTYPIGLSYLSGVLARTSISFRTINNSECTYSINDIVNFCEAEKVKIIGISAVTATIRPSVKIAKAVKEKFNDKIHIILGNSHVSVDPGVINRYPYFDSAIDGEADNFIEEHIRKILQGEKPVGVFMANPPYDLDSLPFPAYERVENTIYNNAHGLPIIGTRGCPFKCGYCGRDALSKKVRSRSPQQIVEEMKVRMAYTKEFFFTDDAATLNRNHIISLCETIIKMKMKIRFYMITRMDALNDDMVRLLKKAGCQHLLIGIESGSERIRQEIVKKNLSDEKIFKGMEITSKNKLPVQLFFMIGHPEETISEIMDTINFPLKLEKMGFNNIELVGFHNTIVLPGTAYFDWYLKRGKINPTIIDDYIQDKLGDGYFGYWPYLIPDGLDIEDMAKLRAMGNRKFHLRPKFIFRRFLKTIGRPKQLIDDAKHAYFVLKKGTSADISKVES